MKSRVFWSIAIPILLVDRLSKMLAASELQPAGIPHEVIGDAVRFTLLFNRDAAMNISLGAWSRWGFAAIAVLGGMFMLRLLQQAPERATGRAAALAMVAAGAAGNLIDRLRWDRGVVDFIDVGIGSHRFWTFNVADTGVTIGALLLAFVFSRERPVPVSNRDL